jgi:L-asparaginase II
MTSAPLVVEAVRGGIVESVHLADLAIVDASGILVDQAGDPLTVAAFRSSAKPLQAGVCMDAGWEPASEEHLAIACASHNGEPEHVRTVRASLAAAGLDDSALRCPLALPDASLPEVVAAAGEAARVYHNCSGKHAAMLATAAHNGWPLDSYREAQHPIQHANHERLESLAGILLETATDGCGVVTFALPLAAIARAFGAVNREEPFSTAAAAMRRHPFLVAGTGRLDTGVMEALPEITVKGGAEGLVCAAGAGFSLAVKSRDGARRTGGPLLLEALRRAGVLPDPLPDALAAHARPPITGGDRVVGELRLRA